MMYFIALTSLSLVTCDTDGKRLVLGFFSPWHVRMYRGDIGTPDASFV